MKITTVGIDLAKSVFQVHGVDGRGKAVLRKQLKRNEMVNFFATLPPCLIGMEACSSAHHWARKLIALGHWATESHLKRFRLEAEAAGVRGTGIGCYFDDAFHDLLGLTDDRFQSLYHFTAGGPVEDLRLRTLAPYAHLRDRGSC